MKKVLIMLALFFLLPLPAKALDSEDKYRAGSEEPMLQSYEANRIGWTLGRNDVGFMDFTVSLQYPFLSLEKAVAAKNGQPSGKMLQDIFTRYLRPVPYLAFTGRFGQYLDTRESSPVIVKKFNPRLFLRFFSSDPVASHLDIGYVHESNGQRINTATAYQEIRAEFANDNEDPDFANDYISRGWDYWEVLWHKNYNSAIDASNNGLATRISFKYFMEYGYLQGDPEEYNSWENDSNGGPRKEFDGITASLMYKTPSRDLFKWWKIRLGVGGGAVIYTTGYKSAFTNNTLRVEIMAKIGNLPLLFWVAEGYNSDLVDYYRRVRSGGFCLDLKTF